MEDALVGLLSDLGAWALVVMAVIVFAESGLLAFFLPGDSMLFAAGVLAATGTIPVPVPVVAVVIAVAAFSGDQVGYLIGRRYGPRVLNRPGSRLLSPTHVHRSRVFFARYGARSLVLARFLPVVRSFVPVLAGVGRMPRHRFVLFSLAGASFWAFSLVLAGGALGRVDWIAHHVGLVGLGLVALAMAPVALSAVRRRLRRDRTITVALPERADCPAA